MLSKIHSKDAIGPIVITRNNGKTINGFDNTNIFTKRRFFKKNYKHIMEHLEAGV